MADDDSDLRPTGGRCSTCGKPAILRWRPFCSKRCADLDLGRWLSESYRIPGSGDDEPDDDGGGLPPGSGGHTVP